MTISHITLSICYSLKITNYLKSYMDYNPYMSTNLAPLYSDHAVSIDSICLESYPCQHRVCYKNKCQTMFATDIIKLLRKLGKPITDHFKYAISMHKPF